MGMSNEVVFKIEKYNTIESIKAELKTCIDLLKQEGSDTKQQVLEKLEELVKWHQVKH